VEIAERYVFRCTNCGKKIPWRLSKTDIGIAEREDPANGGTYPYEKCWCGWGKFVKCEDTQATGRPSEVKPAIEAEIKKKIDQARYAKLRLAEIHPKPNQPRKFFDKAALQSLADSIATIGLLEDILVRLDKTNGGYEIVLGERRWRAAQIAGLEMISCKVSELTDQEAKLISIVENVQREDLTEVEEAFSFKSYIDSGMSVGDVGHALGRMDDRVAGRLKTLSTHYYVKFQEDRIKELTVDNENLKARLRAVRNDSNRYQTRLVPSKEKLVESMNDGWEFIVQLSDGEFLVRKKVT
jgi:ParB/RepB/Spo0J family partition protein